MSESRQTNVSETWGWGEQATCRLKTHAEHNLPTGNIQAWAVQTRLSSAPICWDQHAPPPPAPFPTLQLWSHTILYGIEELRVSFFQKPTLTQSAFRFLPPTLFSFTSFLCDWAQRTKENWRKRRDCSVYCKTCFFWHVNTGCSEKVQTLSMCLSFLMKHATVTTFASIANNIKILKYLKNSSSNQCFIPFFTYRVHKLRHVMNSMNGTHKILFSAVPASV